MNRRGFTLIELLAVIVILAIIATIAVPIVLNIINSSKKQVDKINEDNYARALELALTRYQLKENKVPKNLSELKDYIEYDGEEITCKTDIYEDLSIYLYDCEKNGQKILNYTYGKRKLPKNIGEKVNYNANVEGYSGSWRILGTENGHIMLLSDSIGKLTLEGRDGVNTGVKKLNELAEQYGHGVGAVGARSVMAEDINKIADYKPINAIIGEKEDGTPIYDVFGVGTVAEYGVDTTYTLKNGKITYSASNGITETFSLEEYSKKYDGFEYLTDLTGKNLKNGETFSIKNGYYEYSVSTYVTTPTYGYNGMKRHYIPVSEDILNMLNGSDNAKAEIDNYWLANEMVFAKPVSLSWGIMCYGVASERTGNVMRPRLWNAYQGSLSYNYNVRVVVYLDEDVTLIKDAEGVWQINNIEA